MKKCTRCGFEMDFRNDCFLVPTLEDPDIVDFEHWECPECGEEVAC